MAEEKKLDIHYSPNFGKWLKSHKCTLAFTTYQVGKVFMLGTNLDSSIHVSERTFPRCMGLAMKDNTVWMSSIFQIWRFENSLLPNQNFQGHDKVYIPQMAYTTGGLDVHDMIVGQDDKPVFVNTLFNCVATLSETHSFKPLWKPPFITELVPEDRCHINGLASSNGKPAYVTIVGETNKKGDWRNYRSDGGVVMDVRTNEVVCRGLSMPHSPRLYQDKLWLLEAGTGYFGYVNMETKTFVRVLFCHGFLRGLTFIGDYAIVGLSKSREHKIFSGLALEDNLKAKGEDPVCGLRIININSGKIEAFVTIEGVVRELFDVMVMPNIIKPILIGTIKEDIHRMVSIEP